MINSIAQKSTACKAKIVHDETENEADEKPPRTMRRQPEPWGGNLQLYPRKRTNYIRTGHTHPYAQLHTHVKTHVHKELQKQS